MTEGAALSLDAWNRCWAALGATTLPATVHAQLLSRYSEPHRAYHTLQHLQECLELRRDLAAPDASAAEIDIALWFHDAIYEPTRSDNEARSADWLDDVATSAGLAPEVRERLRRLVMVTRHSVAPATTDEALLVDIDLSILGAPPARFSEYEEQVRQEYLHVPAWIFRRKRREILVGFLARDAIYTTAQCRQRFEAQARRNLAESIAALG